MASNSDYGEIVKQAEAAVASIKDGDLKTIAFGKILDTLLGLESNTKDQGRSSSSKEGTKHQKGQNIAGSKPARKKSGPKSYVEELIEDNFFNSPKTLAAIRAELGNRGHHIAVTSLSGPMMTLCSERRLRRQKVKDGKKQTYTYSPW